LAIFRKSIEALLTKVSRTNSATGSTAKKFVTTGAVQNNTPTPSTKNSQHVTSLASNLKAIALSAQAIAKTVQQSTTTLRTQIASIAGAAGSTTRSPVASKDPQIARLGKIVLARRIDEGFQGIDPEVRGIVSTTVTRILDHADRTALPRPVGIPTRTINTVVPELESVAVDLDPHKGMIDGFFAHVTFNVKYNPRSNVKAFRVFRASIDNPSYTRPLGMISSTGLQRIQAAGGKKNQDFVSFIQARLQESGVSNAITALTPLNPFTNLRTSTSDSTLFVPPARPGQNFESSDGVPEALAHLDRSVLQNVKILANLQNDTRLGSSVSLITAGIRVGALANNGLHTGLMQRNQIAMTRSNNQLMVEQNNRDNFEEIAFLTPDKVREKRIGNLVEYSWDDTTILYGRGYKYFVVSVDSNMNQSSRSQMASIVVEGLRVPERPRTVVVSPAQTSISLAMSAEDQLIEKFEIYRREDDPNARRITHAVTIADSRGFAVSTRERTIGQNNFLLIGETANPIKGGASFNDKDVKPGGRYLYRIYSVDVFGNKSESPKEVTAIIPDLEAGASYLRKPTILAERDATTQKMRVTFGCTDKNVTILKLERRDLSTGQQNFTTPSDYSRVIMGKGKVLRRHSIEGEKMQGSDTGYVWNGIFDNRGDEIVFIDHSVTIDHIYQYRVHGLDVYGTRTSYDVSRPVMVIRRPFIDAPLQLTSSMVYGDSSLQGVRISWQDANLNYSAEDLLGSQAQLQDSSVRTLYQIERKKMKEEIWQRFPLVAGTEIFDPVALRGTKAPSYRPSYLELNEVYEYRVQAVQTGAFISNFTTIMPVFVGYQVFHPESFMLKTPPTNTRPFYVMLNWNTDPKSGIVDYWEIERAEVNNFAASRLNMRNPSDFDRLTYKPFRSVYREASRFSSQERDARNSSKMISGQHHYMDTMVDFGNSYVYRIRAVNVSKEPSQWVYKGVKLTNGIFEQKLREILTLEERDLLTKSFEPMITTKIWALSPTRTTGLQPNYSRPPSTRIDY
jgi:hypothetical protein